MRAERQNLSPLFGVSGIIKNDDFCKMPTVIESQQASSKNRYLLGKPLLTAENNIFSWHILVHIDTPGRVPIISGTYRQISSCVPRNSCTRDVAYQKKLVHGIVLNTTKTGQFLKIQMCTSSAIWYKKYYLFDKIPVWMSISLVIEQTTKILIGKTKKSRRVYTR